MSATTIALPRLPEPPYTIEELPGWASAFKREMEKFTDQFNQSGADNQLTGRVEDQPLVDGFTINPSSPKIGIVSTSEIASSASIAIKAGRNGQTIELYNQSSFSIILIDKALIRCVNDQNLIMFPNDVVQFHWDIRQVKWMQIGSAGIPSATQIASISTPIAEQAAANATSGLIPTGAILLYHGNTPPVGFLLCNGSDVSRALYADLFSLLGTIYGTDSETTFKLPDMRGRFPRGADSVFGIGTRGGSDVAAITLAQENLPPHTHTYDQPGATVTVDTTTLLINVAGPRTLGVASGQGPGLATPINVSIVNPFVAVNYVIKT